MAIARDTTAANIRPLEGAIVRRFTAGAAIDAGAIVAMSSDGKVDMAITTGICAPLGVAIQAATADGDRIDVVTYGPIQCLTGATPGLTVFASDTAGAPAEAAGTKKAIAGVSESATVLFVRGAIVDLA